MADNEGPIEVSVMETEDGVRFLFPRAVAVDYRNLLMALPNINAYMEAAEERDSLNQLRIENLGFQLNLYRDRETDLRTQIKLIETENAAYEAYNKQLVSKIRTQNIINYGLTGLLLSATGVIVYLTITK